MVSPKSIPQDNSKAHALYNQMSSLESQLHSQINNRVSQYRAQQNPHYDYGHFNTITGM